MSCLLKTISFIASFLSTALARGQDTPGTGRWAMLDKHLKEKYHGALDSMLQVMFVVVVVVGAKDANEALDSVFEQN